MEERKGRRIVLFPLPLQGHINPMFELANILHSRGFSIIILHTTLNSPDPSKYPHFTFHFLHEKLTETEAEASGLDTISLVILLNIKCCSPFEDCLSRLLSDESEEPIACLISDAIFYFTGGVADILRIPRFVLRTGGAASFFVFSAFPFLREKGYIPIQESQLEEAIIEFPPLKVKDLPIFNKCISESLYQLILNMVNATKTSSGIIWNTFQELEQEPLASLHHDFTIPIYPIGPFHKFNFPSPITISSSQDETYISWLNQQAPKSVLYVSFGSIAAINGNQFTEIAWGLANSNQPFLWVVRPGLVKGKEWLELLPNGFVEELNGRGKIIKWANQIEVLGHGSVGAFWSHNGWNSTLESICEGVPMICMPCFTDQGINARYVSDVWRVGLQLEKGLLERKEIEICIKRLMVEKEGEEIRERSMLLKEKACFAWKQDGSSFQWLNKLVDHILSLDSFVFQAQ
ncbi:UDP-glycosyltransferase 76F1-like [Euphorbia lathyris]|uniref:UDP-glycosyltransferase 76F1-like n=1 Tax=Euphorbia lathyris TaxID=212925 RepID=UPI0033139362